MATRRHGRGSGPPVHVVIAWAGVARPATGPCRVSNPSALSGVAPATLAGGGRRRHTRHAHRRGPKFGAAHAGGLVRARDLAMGMLLACTSLVANAVVSGDGSVTPRTAVALPEPFMLQGAAAGPPRVGASVVATATALASSAYPLTGSGSVIPVTATGQSDGGSPGLQADGAVAPSGAVEPADDPVAVPSATPPSEPVEGAPGGEPQRAVVPVLQPVTELLAPAVQPVVPSAVTEPALSMLSPSLVA